MKGDRIAAEKAGLMIDYQWLPADQVAVFERKDKLRAQASPVCGFAIDTNGDWLLVSAQTSCQGTNDNTLWRSTDSGRHWRQVSTIPKLDYYEGYWYGCNGLLVTRQGRIITNGIRTQWQYARIPHRRQKRKKGAEDPVRIGEDPPGRFLVAQPGYLHNNFKIYVAYSDDSGKTWETTEFLDTSPLQMPQSGSVGPPVEAPNGDIIMPFQGFLEEGIAYGWISCSNYMRSRDGGNSWEEAVIIARGEDERGQWFNEIAVLPRKDKPWVAMVRMNPMFRFGKPSGHGMIGGYRCLSYDDGKTWTLPEPINHIVAYPVLLELRDGSILFASSHWAASYMYISHDDGLSWSYSTQVPLSGGDSHYWIQPDDDTVVVAHKDITHQKVLLTWFRKQPTTKSISIKPPQHPEHRWVMRDLKNIYVDAHLKPYSTSTRLPGGTIVVAGVSGESKDEVFAVTNQDVGKTWSGKQQICRPKKYARIYPSCMAALEEKALIIICTEADQLEQHNTPTILRTLISEDLGKNWQEVGAIEEIEGISCLWPGSGMIRDAAGNIVLPVSGTDKEGLSVCGTVRSRGPTGKWGLFQPISKATSPDDILDQPAVIALNDGRWLGVLRANLAEYRNEYTNIYTKIGGGVKAFRQPPLWQVTSSDEGKTWTKPEHVCSAHYPHLLRLPDGGLIMTDILSSTLRYQISYNDGASWSFENFVIGYPDRHFCAGAYRMSDFSVVVLDDRTVLGTYFCNDEYEGGPRIVATWIRALPKDLPEARERGL